MLREQQEEERSTRSTNQDNEFASHGTRAIAAILMHFCSVFHRFLSPPYEAGGENHTRSSEDDDASALLGMYADAQDDGMASRSMRALYVIDGHGSVSHVVHAGKADNEIELASQELKV